MLLGIRLLERRNNFENKTLENVYRVILFIITIFKNAKFDWNSMSATIIGYRPLRSIVPYKVIEESAPKKGFSFLESLKTEEEQVKFFEKSLCESVYLSSEEVPENLMNIRRAKHSDILFKINREYGIIFGVYINRVEWTQTVVTVYNYYHHMKGFPLREVARYKGSLVDIVA